MNRLIIVGNGFDIAHNLRTKYSDFISSYWGKIKYTTHSDEFFDFVLTGHNIEKCTSLKEVLAVYDEAGIYLQPRNSKSSVLTQDGRFVLHVYNEFFCRINEKYDEVNWVDIEMEYYSSLKRILNRPAGKKSEDSFNSESLELITTLNKEIAQLAVRFEEYLENEVKPNIKSRKNEAIVNILQNEELHESQLEFIYTEYPKRSLNEIKADYESRIKFGFVKKFGQTFILNFNYTNTVYNYFANSDSTIINIHGQIKSADNPINLGFGDERDKFYSVIEDHNENEYLKFMKSFYYTNNENYKKLFDFIEDGSFQVQIVGHSCGLSDRTLLNAIFENKHCKSIKVFYHKYVVAKEDGETDNYSQLVRNISRHFNQKIVMREKILNKTSCELLPQL